MTRKWRDGSMAQLIKQVKLLMIDEVHLLHEERGAVLEAVVSRMKTIKQGSDMAAREMRFIAVHCIDSTQKVQHTKCVQLSATIPNINDIGQWLGSPQEGIKLYVMIASC